MQGIPYITVLHGGPAVGKSSTIVRALEAGHVAIDAERLGATEGERYEALKRELERLAVEGAPAVLIGSADLSRQLLADMPDAEHLLLRPDDDDILRNVASRNELGPPVSDAWKEIRGFFDSDPALSDLKVVEDGWEWLKTYSQPEKEVQAW